MIQTQQPNSQIFTIWSDEIEGRIDPYYFQAKTLKKEAREVLENAREEVEKMILK